MDVAQTQTSMTDIAELDQAISVPKGQDFEGLYQVMCTENLMILE